MSNAITLLIFRDKFSNYHVYIYLYFAQFLFLKYIYEYLHMQLPH